MKTINNDSKFESLSKTKEVDFINYGEDLANPFNKAIEWFDEAKHMDAIEPRTMILSTVDKSMLITSRAVATLSMDEKGIMFATHNCSKKIKSYLEINSVCAHYYWKELGRQLTISGTIEKLNREIAISVWNKRPLELDAMTIISRQSEILDKTPEEFLKQVISLKQGVKLPCPENFEVYLINPQYIEFWEAQLNRFHKRIVCNKVENNWRIKWLQP